MKKVFVFLLLLTVSAHAQEHNIWYFGHYAGLDFNNGAPVTLTDGQLASTVITEGNATIADNNGELLFYTDGVTVWNRNHTIMDNGQELMGHISSNQSALIVPQPGSTTLYYIFTTTASGYEDGFRYSVIDMEGDNGLGTVTDKNILLHTPTSEAVNATWHTNGEDIWVVAHNDGNAVFSAYLVTANGVTTTPVTSPVGATVTTSSSGIGGAMKMSPDGSQLAFNIWNYGTQLFDFDKTTGSVSNPTTLSTITNGNYGIEFSPSGEVLYVSNRAQILQYDLLANDIGASETEIYAQNPGFIGEFGSLQKGPDNKIYVARKQLNIVSVINDPNILGTGCNFEENGVNLEERHCFYGLPNTVLSPETVPPPTAPEVSDIEVCDTNVLDGSETIDLTQQAEALQAGQPNTALTYFENETDAETDTNAIAEPTAYTNTNNPQTIYVRIANVNSPDDYAIANFEIWVTEENQLPQDLQLIGCSSLGFNLTRIEEKVDENLILTFYEEEIAALAANNSISENTNYITNSDEVMIYIRAENENGCATVVPLYLLTDDCTIPEGISPNSDGKNDNFDLTSLTASYGGDIVVYNRNGREVFSQYDYSNEWFGQDKNGNELPTGIYYYVLHLSEEHPNYGQTIARWVYVQR